LIFKMQTLWSGLLGLLHNLPLTSATVPRATIRTTIASTALAEPPATAEPASSELTTTAEAEAPLANSVYMLGDYLVGDGDDAQLGGHPDIRY
jgi:hypothetical protein